MFISELSQLMEGIYDDLLPIKSLYDYTLLL